MTIPYSLVTTEDDAFITVFVPGRDPLPASKTHPNFEAIVAACEASRRGEPISADDVADLFDVAATVSRKFERLSERVTVDANGIMLDGDPVHGTLQQQILDFLDAGEDFGPLVSFYEKLTTNPLGDVRDGLFDWIKGQTANGDKLTISQDGNVLGYKSVDQAKPEWRIDEEVVYVPTRRGAGTVNGIEVNSSQFIEQVPGDVVEMPRSKVLNAPSQACGDGLHIGTWSYAQNFYGDTTMLVEFSPRDIVSLPDTNSTWKLRVCRYKVIGPVDEPLDVPVYLTAKDECGEECEDGCLGICDQVESGIKKGDRLQDNAGDWATALEDEANGRVRVRYDCLDFCQNGLFSQSFFASAEDPMDMTFAFEAGDRIRDDLGDEGVVDEVDEDGDLKVEFNDGSVGYVFYEDAENLTKRDPKGRFVAGRPGSKRDARGRFV